MRLRVEEGVGGWRYFWSQLCYFAMFVIERADGAFEGGWESFSVQSKFLGITG